MVVDGPTELLQNFEIAVAIEPSQVTTGEEGTGATTTGLRKTTKFAKQCIMGKRSLFLKKDFMSNYTDDSTELVGQIWKCARADNGNFCTVNWNNQGHDLPDGLQIDWLRTKLPLSTGVKEELMDGMKRFQEAKPAANENAKTRKARSKSKPAEMPPLTTPQNVARAQHAASAMTASSIGTAESASPTVATASTTRTSRSSCGSNAEEFPFEDDTPDGEDMDEEDSGWIQFDSDAYNFGDDNADDVDGDEEEEQNPQPSTDIGKWMSEVEWEMEEISDDGSIGDDTGPIPCQEDTEENKPGLKRGVASKFHDPLQCLECVGGLSCEFTSKLARNSNDFCKKHILPDLDKNKRLHGVPWRDISTEEMYRFLGLTLKISLSPVDGGGYRAYFETADKFILDVLIKGSKGFASTVVPFYRFLQIRSAFHPVDRSAALGGDKAYQLRGALNQFNACSRRAFQVGKWIVFDEGGVPCRSRFCPIRQYNPNKPDKFRVDFFILACSRNYVIHHLDVYQGKNPFNAGIHPAIADLPTTQKAVLNAIISSNLHTETRGARHLAMDNRYMCPELGKVLRDRFNIYSTGTTRLNRKGFPKAILNLSKKDARGSLKLAYDKHNKVVCGQWNDNKVVNFCSTVVDSRITKVKRRVGRDLKEFPCPKVLTAYQKTMFGVDKADQKRLHWGGFSAKGHYKKWYKRSFLATLDCMLLNSHIAWNYSTRTHDRQELLRHEYYTYISERMMNYRDAHDMPSPGIRRVAAMPDVPKQDPKHYPVELTPDFFDCKKANVRCAVCRMESRWNVGVSQKGLGLHAAQCKECGVVAHTIIPDQNPRKIHTLECFKGMTCFQIMHTKEGNEIWPRKVNARTGITHTHKISHPLVQELRSMCGLSKKVKRPNRKKRNREDEEQEDEEDDYEEEEFGIEASQLMGSMLDDVSDTEALEV